jgi:two-component system response regulator FixJ
VDSYASGAEFLNADTHDAPDCLVLDLNMPQMTGFDVQVRLAQSGKSTPVIVITGDDTPEAHSRALRLGAKTCLEKPVDQSTLLAAIGIAIGGVSP